MAPVIDAVDHIQFDIVSMIAVIAFIPFRPSPAIWPIFSINLARSQNLK